MGAYDRNPVREARAGLITLAITLGASAGLVGLTKVSWQRPSIHRVGFRVNQDATGVIPGTPVTMGGLQWGGVTRVEHGEVPASGRREDAIEAMRAGVTRGTLVTFSLDPRIRLMPGARIARTGSLLGGGVELVITDTGLTRGSMDVLPTKGRDALAENTVINAASAPSGWATLFGLKTAAQLGEIPEAFVALRDSVKSDLFGAAGPGGTPTGTTWSEQFETARAAGARIAALFEEPAPDRPTLTGDLDRVQDELRPAWNGAEAAMKDLAERVEAEWNTRGERLWSQARDEWKRLQSVWDRCRAAGTDAMDTYRDFMADSSLMGDQIRLLFDEPVRTIVLYYFGRPDARGISRLSRFEAASRLAIATADLRHANDALEWLANASKPVDPAVANDLRARAARAAEAFGAAIERLVQLSQQP